MSASHKLSVPYPLGFAVSAANAVSLWRMPEKGAVLVAVESRELCHGLIEVQVSYSPGMVVSLRMIERGILNDSSGNWEIVDGRVTYRDGSNREISDPLHRSVFGSLQGTFHLRAPICLMRIEGTVYVLPDPKSGRVFRRLKLPAHLQGSGKSSSGGSKRGKGKTGRQAIFEYPFSDVDEYLLAQQAAAARVTEMEASMKRKAFETKISKGKKSKKA